MIYFIKTTLRGLGVVAAIAGIVLLIGGIGLGIMAMIAYAPIPAIILLFVLFCFCMGVK